MLGYILSLKPKGENAKSMRGWVHLVYQNPRSKTMPMLGSNLTLEPNTEKGPPPQDPLSDVNLKVL
jgi:hypothetical protein